MQTNYSGKFVITEEPLIEEDIKKVAKDLEPEVDVTAVAAIIPAVPETVESKMRQYMADIRRLFGEFWWLWLVVLVLYLANDSK